jgi:RNA ligase
MNKELLKQMLDEKLVSVQKHPKADLFIYNYSPKVQYDRLWNEITLQTRGLILDAEMNVIARPFGKFFNLEEHQPEEIPKLAFDVFEKMDGSLGILYWLNDMPFISTRGSFESEQSIKATEILHKRYSDTFIRLDKNSTYLFEIIYPQNRIVVDYGDIEDLFLLARIDNATGQDLPIYESTGFPIVKRFDGINELQQLKSLEVENKEGFVVRFKNGFRVKMKFAEYVKLHRIITGVSNIAIWEYLAEGKSFEELLKKVPDEFYNWVKKIQSEIVNEFDKILTESKSVFKELETRKETALYFQKQKYPSVLFSMLDGKAPDKIIWKMVRPKYSKPYKVSE